MIVAAIEYYCIFFSCICLFIYLVSLGLGCNTDDLSSWHAGSVVVVCRLSCPTARGILLP